MVKIRMLALPNNLGFTLLELMVVLVLLSLLTALGARFLSRPKTSVALAKINTLLEQARFQAMYENRRIELSCADMITITPHGETVLCHFNTFLPETAQTLAFFPDGSSNGGYIVWRRQEQTNTLSIDWLTGRVSHVTQ